MKTIITFVFLLITVHVTSAQNRVLTDKEFDYRVGLKMDLADTSRNCELMDA